MNWKHCTIAILFAMNTPFLVNIPAGYANTSQANATSTNPELANASPLQNSPNAWVTPKEAAPKGAMLRLTPTRKTTQTGERLLHLDLIVNGKIIQQIQAVSGKPDVQHFRIGQQSRSGSREPLPQGIYRVGAVDRGAGLPLAMGDTFIPVTPLFTTARSGIGIHRDADRHLPGGSGTIGCLGILSQKGMQEVANFVTTYRPKTLVVDYGLAQETIAAK